MQERGRRRRMTAAASASALAIALSVVVPLAAMGAQPRTRVAAELDRQNLRLAAFAVEAQALTSGALRHPVAGHRPAVVLYESVLALLREARAGHPTGRPTDTRRLMGPVPINLAHRVEPRPSHRQVWATHTLARFRGSVPVGGSAGIGTHTIFRHSRPAPFQRPDRVYVDPRIPMPAHPTVAAVAIRAAMQKLGHPYVWAAAGPATFDCSGLVRYAYGRAGVNLTHYTVSQWNEGRLVPPRSALPGDLVLVGHTLHHVGIYLGAGWMVNAPFTGHYVDVVPVPRQVAGVVRP